MKAPRYLSIAALVFCSYGLIAQEVPSDIKQQLENLAEVTDAETEDDSFLQQIAYLKKDPLNLNTATSEDLQVFPFLTDLQINSLIRYRMALGKLVSIYELQAVPSWDVATIQKLLPYVTTEAPVALKTAVVSWFNGGESYLMMRASRILEKARGFDTSLNNHYLGDRNRLFVRYRYQYKNLLQYGLTADKDAGEQFFKGAQKSGFDFYSAHLFARNIGLIKAIAIGDFTVNLGQGLVHWQSLAFKKSAEVISIKRQSPVLKPYTSSGEFYFNRGAGITLNRGKMEATVFVSLRSIDANTFTDTTANELFSGFATSGLHRTAAEIADRQSVQQTSFGGNLNYQNSFFKLGMNAVSYQFSKPLQKRDEPYNLYSIKGDSWSNASVDYSLTSKNIHFFGEAAVDAKLNKAFLNGALISADSKIDVSILHRYIEKDYQSVYGNAFTENVLPVNENGVFAGVTIKPASFLNLKAYLDLFKFPWLKYRTDAPGSGQDYFLQLTYQPDKQFEIYTRYRNENKTVNAPDDNAVTNYARGRSRQNWRVHFAYNLNPKFTFRSRMDMLWWDKEGQSPEQGFLFFVEGLLKPAPRFDAAIRMQYFETDSYDSRIYAYENDVAFSYSIPAFFNKGFRYYININYGIGKRCELWFRYAQTVFKGKNRVGSGLNELNGNKQSECKIQLRYNF